MPAEHENLADYLRRVISEKGLRYRQVVERSGRQISASAISDIISGRTKEIKSKTITALAKGLDVPEAEIFAIVRGRSLDNEEQANLEKEQLWEMYSDIPRQCQKDVMDLLAVLKRNHSLSDRQQKREQTRRAVAEHKNGLRAVDDQQPEQTPRSIHVSSLTQGRDSQLDDDPRQIHVESLGSAQIEEHASEAQRQVSGGRTKKRIRH